jgi:hypothetical protein
MWGSALLVVDCGQVGWGNGWVLEEADDDDDGMT